MRLNPNPTIMPEIAPLTVTTMDPPTGKNPLPPPFAPVDLLLVQKIKMLAQELSTWRNHAELLRNAGNPDQQAIDKQEKKDKLDHALRNAAEIEDKQRREDVQCAGTSNERTLPFSVHLLLWN
jgi:hypothetical protein